MTKENKKKLFTIIALVLLLVLVLYFYTYFFANKTNKVIYQDSLRRIYLNEKKEYRKNGQLSGRLMWKMVYEDMKTGQRWFVAGNSKKGFTDKKMAKILLNTVDQGKLKSFDHVEGAGVTLALAKSDVHSNLISKKGVSDIKFPEMPDMEI